MYSQSEIEARLAGIDSAGEFLLPLTPIPPSRPNPYVTIIGNNAPNTNGSAGNRNPQLFRRLLTWDSIFRLLGLLWCVPALWVLVVNFRQRIVGASLWCISCYPNPFSVNYSSEAAHLLVKDHDVIGLLQLVAKALEIWFLAVAASLIHDLISIRAERGSGIAFELLTAYLEFKEVRYLFSPHLWRSASMQAKRKATAIFGYLLVLLVATLAIEAAVIGPAMAVLLIPTIQLRDVRHVPGPIAQLAAGDPPSNPWLANCTNQLLSIGNYSCSGPQYSSSLDAIISSAAFSNVTQPNAFLTPGISQEGSLFFQLNVTQEDRNLFVWAPNRFVIRQVSDEFNLHLQESVNQTAGLPAPDLDSSQQTVYHRIGPAVSVRDRCLLVNVSVTVVGPAMEIRCYGVGHALGLNVSTNTCVKYGSGWNLGIDQSQFFLGWEDKWDKTWVADVNVTVFQTDQRFDVPWDSQDCPTKQAYDGQWLLDESCPWNDLFGGSTPSPATYVEYHVPGVTFPNQTVLCGSSAYLGFRDYVFDGLVLQKDRLDLVTINELSPNVSAMPIRVHPDWLLASWSVDRNGTVPSGRSSARLVVEAIKLTLDDPSDGNMLYMTLLQQLVHSQAASLVTYHTVPFNGTADISNPRLDTWRTIKVYSYGFFSTTTELSAVAVIVGILCCFGHTIHFLIRGPPGFRSIQDLLAMAFRYRPGPEIEGEDGGDEIRKMEIRIVSDPRGDSCFAVSSGNKGKEASGDQEGGNAQSGLLHGGERGGGGGEDPEVQGSSSSRL